MGDAHVRQAEERDLVGLPALYRDFHAFHVRGLPEWLRLPDMWEDEATRDTLRSLLAREDAAILVAEEGGTLVGLAEVYWRDDEVSPLTVARRYGYLQSLLVVRERRGHGIDRLLLAASERWSVACGATEMRLNVWEFADGPLGFYEAAGYATVKRTLARSLHT